MSEQPERTWWSRNWKWVVPAGCLTPVLVCGGFVALILTLVFGMIKSSPPYTESLAAVKANAEAQQELGNPIEPGFFVTGGIETSGDSGDADITYAVSGPNGSGTVHAVADKAAGQWTFTTLELAIEATGQRIDLLPQQ